EHGVRVGMGAATLGIESAKQDEAGDWIAVLNGSGNAPHARGTERKNLRIRRTLRPPTEAATQCPANAVEFAHERKNVGISQAVIEERLNLPTSLGAEGSETGCAIEVSPDQLGMKFLNGVDVRYHPLAARQTVVAHGDVAKC